MSCFLSCQGLGGLICETDHSLVGTVYVWRHLHAVWSVMDMYKCYFPSWSSDHTTLLVAPTPHRQISDTT